MVSGIQSGDTVLVRGTVSGTSVTATTIIGDGMPAMHKADTRHRHENNPAGCARVICHKLCYGAVVVGVCIIGACPCICTWA